MENKLRHFAVRIDSDVLHFVARCGYESDDPAEFVNGRNFINPNLDKITCPICRGDHATD